MIIAVLIESEKNIECAVLKGHKRHICIFIFANYVATPNYPSLIKFLENIFTCKELFKVLIFILKGPMRQDIISIRIM